MMSLHSPTDVGDEGIRFYLQNCGANSPLFCAQLPLSASNDDLVTGGADTASAVSMRPVVDTTVELRPVQVHASTETFTEGL